MGAGESGLTWDCFTGSTDWGASHWVPMAGSTLVSLSLHWSLGCEIVPLLSTSCGRRETSEVETVSKETRARWGEITSDICTGTTGARSFALTSFRRYAGVSALSQGALLEGRTSGLPRLKQKKLSWGLSLVTVLMSVQIDEKADGMTHSKSESGWFAECNRHWTPST